MKIEKFEDIQAWQEARVLTNLIYEATKGSLFSKDYGLKDQIQRAAVSIMANIAEGFDAASDVEFIKFLIYSRRSASEIQSHLYVALDQKYITQEKFQELYEEAKKVKGLIGGFIKYLKKPRPRTPDIGPRT
jgi:four helix bundle protein